MNTPTDLSGSKWKAPMGIAGFASASRNWGVVNSQGQAISRDGVAPSVWRTKAIAAEVAPYVDGFRGYTWVEIF